MFLRVLVGLFVSLGSLAASLAQGPTIDKVDPPNWFAAMPSPMLLVHGTGLAGATFSGAKTRKTLTSPNGHWALVELDTRGLRAGTLQLTARTAAGSAHFAYALAPRRTEGVSGFSPADVMMCIMPDRFADGDLANDHLAGFPAMDRSAPRAYHGGDLKGVIDHLDYLQELGVTAVWLTPVLANDPARQDYHGYGAADMYAVEPRLGTLKEYQTLASELHRRHMKLLYDDVPNHVGPGSPWVKDPPLPNWFHGSAAEHTEATYDFGKITDPHLPENAAAAELNGWFANVLPDMNQQNPWVAQYEVQNMIWWIEETGLDGLRIDTFPFVQRKFWQGYLSELKRFYPRLTSVGEVDSPDPTIDSYFAGDRTIAGVDTGLDTPFDYPYFFALRDVLVHGKPFSTFESSLRQDWLYPHPERLVTILGNHDQMRFMSEPGATPELMRLATGLTLTLRGTPQLYIGDEVLMEGKGDPDNRQDFPGGFAGDAANAFVAEGRTPAQARMHDFTAALGQLRARTPALKGGAQQDLVVDNDAFAFVRTAGGVLEGSACRVTGAASILVVVNKSGAEKTVGVPSAGTVLEGCSGLSYLFGDRGTVQGMSVKLPAFGFALYRLE